MEENIQGAFDELRSGIQRMEEDASRGNIRSVREALIECLAAIAELEQAVMRALRSRPGA